MKKFYDKITRHPKVIIVIFAMLAVISFFCNNLVAVNYDMNDYLPKDSKSTVSLEIMEEEFEGGIPNCRVMISNITIPEALEYKEKLLEIDGVSDVTWLDDVVSITEPIETLDSESIIDYYKDNYAIFSVTVDESKTVEAVDDIRKLIGDENSMTGSAVSTAVATVSTVSEIAKIAVIAVIMVLIILIFTTEAWIEPFLVLGTLGVAIIINSGSNIILGEISFVTNAAGTILQLAVSLDYSVFLLHRFTECRKETSDVREAMVQALCKSTSSILSSGVTTVIGFLALCLMQFGIGPDLGRALAKGIAISLVTTFVFSPALILSTYKIIDKTHHKPFMPSFKKLGKVVTKVMIPLSCVFAVVILPSYLASVSNEYYYGSSHIFNEQTQIGSDKVKVEEIFGKGDNYVIMVPKGNEVKEKELIEELESLNKVKSIISYSSMVGLEIPTEYLDDDILSQLMSDNYSRIVVSVNVDYEGTETFALIEKIEKITNKYFGDSYYIVGEGISTYDLKNTITADMVKVNLIAILAVFIVLMITSKSLILPIILVLSIETAIWLNMSLPYFTGTYIFYISYLIISSVQLGATVDYAILFSDRYKELRKTLDRKEAIQETISAVTISILTSGLTLVIVGFLLGMISTHGLLSQLGYFLGIGTIFSLVIVMFVLPGLLYVFDGLTLRRSVRKKVSGVIKEV